MNNRDKQVIKKILSEIEVIEQLITGFDVSDFIADERNETCGMYDTNQYRRAC